MAPRNPVASKAGPRSRRRKSTAVADGTPAIRRRRDPFTKEWVPLPAEARAIGLDDRFLRKHIAREKWVRVLGDRWYVRHAEFVAWWEAQRPRKVAR